MINWCILDNLKAYYSICFQFVGRSNNHFAHAGNYVQAEQLRDEGDTSVGRLPTSLYPLHYDLELIPDFYDSEPPFFFDGSVRIRIECRRFTNIIYLNSYQLSVADESIQIFVDPESPVSAEDPEWVSTEVDDDFRFYKIFLDRFLTEDAWYVLELSFSGEIRPPSVNRGLWWDSYIDQGEGTAR